MGRFSGRRVIVGIKKEAARGTAETTGFVGYPFTSLDAGDKTDKKLNESPFGNIVKNNDEITTLKRGEGTYESKMWASLLGHLLTAAFGASPTTTGPTETTAYSHAFALANNNTHSSLSIDLNDTILHETFALSMIDSIKFTWVKDDFTKVEITTQSKAGAVSTATPTILTTDYEFLPKHLAIKLASNLAGLSGATESDDIISISLEIKKNLTVSQTSKSKDQVSDINNTDFEISGSIEKYYGDSTYKGYSDNDTKMAMQLDFISSVLAGASSIPYSLQFKLAKVSFKNWKAGYGSSDLSTETIDFEGLYSLTDAKAIEATLVNKTASYA